MDDEKALKIIDSVVRAATGGKLILNTNSEFRHTFEDAIHAIRYELQLARDRGFDEGRYQMLCAFEGMDFKTIQAGIKNKHQYKPK